MYKSFSVSNFRGLRELEIGPLARVNLIAGKNNVGKTALLEALWMHAGPNIPRLGPSTNAFRGLEEITHDRPFDDLFWKFLSDTSIRLKAQGDWGPGEKTLTLYIKELDVAQLPIAGMADGSSGRSEPVTLTDRYSSDTLVLKYADEFGTEITSDAWVVEKQIARGVQELVFEARQAGMQKRLPRAIMFPARRKAPVQEDADRFGKLEVEAKHRSVETILGRVDSRLRRLSVIPRGLSSMVHVELDGYDRLVPLALLGDGIARLFSLAVGMGNAPGGLVMVDEIENGLHHTVLKTIWAGLAEFAREFDVQLFATTHSHECVAAAHQAFVDSDEYDFRLHRLERVKNTEDIRCVTYDEETLGVAVAKGFEHL